MLREEIAGCWSADRLYAPGAVEDVRLYLRPDQTGVWWCQGQWGGVAVVLDWSVQGPRLRLRARRSLEADAPGDPYRPVLPDPDTQFDLEVPVELYDAEPPSGPVRALRLVGGQRHLTELEYGRLDGPPPGDIAVLLDEPRDDLSA